MIPAQRGQSMYSVANLHQQPDSARYTINLHAPAREGTASIYLDCFWDKVDRRFVAAPSTSGTNWACTAVSNITNGRMHLLVARVCVAEAVRARITFSTRGKLHGRIYEQEPLRALAEQVLTVDLLPLLALGPLLCGFGHIPAADLRCDVHLVRFRQLLREVCSQISGLEVRSKLSRLCRVANDFKFDRACRSSSLPPTGGLWQDNLRDIHLEQFRQRLPNSVVTAHFGETGELDLACVRLRVYVHARV